MCIRDRYTVAPGIAVTAVASGSGSGFIGTVHIGDGTLGVVTVTDGGGGFSTTTPTVTFNTPLSFTATGVGTTATGVAVVSAAGTIESIRYTNAGAGYTAGDLPISVTIASPSTDSEGNFIFNELVRGSTSGCEARMRTWDATTNVLEVASITGTFILGETIVGTASSASRVLRKIDLDPLDDGFADNLNIETQADSILDFTEQNPFGTP